jgi:hypothetical protein
MDNFTKQLQQLKDTIILRVDKKSLINKLRGMEDNYIELWISPENKRTLTIKDRFGMSIITTKN